MTRSRYFSYDRVAVQAVIGWSTHEVAQLPWFMCQDATGPVFEARLPVLQELASDRTARSCADLRDGCSNLGLSLLRLTCPMTCGCASPLSGLYLSGADHGCPWQCRHSLHFNQALSDTPCVDMDVGALRNMPAWSKYWSQLTSFMTQAGLLNKDKFVALKRSFLQHGCEAMSGAGALLDIADERVNYMLCPQSGAFSGLQVFCPETCGCLNSSQKEGCPRSCAP